MCQIRGSSFDVKILTNPYSNRNSTVGNVYDYEQLSHCFTGNKCGATQESDSNVTMSFNISAATYIYKL